MYQLCCVNCKANIVMKCFLIAIIMQKRIRSFHLFGSAQFWPTSNWMSRGQSPPTKDSDGARVTHWFRQLDQKTRWRRSPTAFGLSTRQRWAVEAGWSRGSGRGSRRGSGHQSSTLRQGCCDLIHPRSIGPVGEGRPFSTQVLELDTLIHAFFICDFGTKVIPDPEGRCTTQLSRLFQTAKQSNVKT